MLEVFCAGKFYTGFVFIGKSSLSCSYKNKINCRSILVIYEHSLNCILDLHYYSFLFTNLKLQLHLQFKSQNQIQNDILY